MHWTEEPFRLVAKERGRKNRFVWLQRNEIFFHFGNDNPVVWLGMNDEGQLIITCPASDVEMHNSIPHAV